MILLVSSLVLLLLVMHRRFRTRTGRLTRAGVLIAVVCAGTAYWQAYRQADFDQQIIRRTQNDPNSALVVCIFPQQYTNDRYSCYDPRDSTEVARHLRECRIVPGAHVDSVDAPKQDERAVPCDYFDQFESGNGSTPTASRADPGQ